ncbi:MAG TPA: translation initiation factor IF-3, partial [Candidatus Eremiobacteraeota bacterium]|nr:translation initiation factor IF-3 [Candidatus Eremiobacteraeota bacterium]
MYYIDQVRTIAKKLKVNERIRTREVRLISDTGEQLGIVSVDEAKRIAEENSIDLVEVSPNARPPVCRLMDYGKFKYLQSKKDRDARKKTKTVEMKEVKMRPKIGTHDLMVKIKMVTRLLEEGDKVKVTILFRGREVSYTAVGNELLGNIAKEVMEIGTVEMTPRLEGKNM